MEEKESTTFQNMMGNVEKIIRDVQGRKVDLDQLVGKVEEGFQLIKTMRQRLEEVRGKVETLRTSYAEKAEDA